MRLRTVAKLGVVISVLLFAVAVAFYALTQLDWAKRNREINLYALVPEDCVAVLESDRLDAFLNDFSSLNYSAQLDNLQFPNLFEFLFYELNEYATRNAHGLSGQMNRLMVSFHTPGNVCDQVIYFRMGDADEQMFADVLHEYSSTGFLPKEEEYRGKHIVVYPLGNEEFLATYSGEGYMALSYQKRLIEEVIDAQLDQVSLNEDVVFTRILSQKKSPSFLTLYTRSAVFPFMEEETEGWSEYDFHLNSDVLYLTGEMYQEENPSELWERVETVYDLPLLQEDGLFVSANRDSTFAAVERACGKNEGGSRTLFDECVANLSREALFTLVVDMDRVIQNPEQYLDYLPSFVLKNARAFQPFVLSVQLSVVNDRPSHIWVFTYKE